MRVLATPMRVLINQHGLETDIQDEPLRAIVCNTGGLRLKTERGKLNRGQGKTFFIFQQDGEIDVCSADVR